MGWKKGDAGGYEALVFLRLHRRYRCLRRYREPLFLRVLHRLEAVMLPGRMLRPVNHFLLGRLSRSLPPCPNLHCRRLNVGLQTRMMKVTVMRNIRRKGRIMMMKRISEIP